MQLHQLLSDTRRGFRNRLFGNNHSIAVNLRYANYHKACKRSWHPSRPITAEDKRIAASFRSTGYEILPPPAEMTAEQLRAIQSKVDRLFSKPNASRKLVDGMYRLIGGLELVPEIVDFIDPELEAIIEAY